MSELFEQLLKLRCIEVHLTLEECRVSFWHGDDGLTVTMEHRDAKSLAAALKSYI